MATSNAYGLMNLWEQGDWITKTVAILLLSMSVLSWSVIVLKSLQLSRLRREAMAAEDSLHAGNVLQSPPVAPVEQSSKEAKPNQENPFHALVYEGLKAVSYHRLHRRQFADEVPKGEWLTLCLQRAMDNLTQKLQADLPVLASIGSTAPFVGLFGTVWGIYHALIQISASGQSSIEQIAGPVGESLIMTAFGLAVAIPAVLGYNALLQSHKKMMNQIRRFAHELQVRLLVENLSEGFDPFDLESDGGEPNTGENSEQIQRNTTASKGVNNGIKQGVGV